MTDPTPSRKRRSSRHTQRDPQALSSAAIQEMFQRLQQLNPKPTTELEYHSTFELLIAVMLSAQATDVSVNKATRKLFPIASTPQAMLALGESGLMPYIASIGLYRTKARNVIASCAQLIDRHVAEVPHERTALEALPGVGRKTANVILNTAFGEPTIAVDTHIFRVANRTGLAPGKNVKEVEARLLQVTPGEFMHAAHHWLILHGRYVCKARAPNCQECLLHDLCLWPDKK